MTSTLQQVADDLASHIGEMRVVMDEMARALKPLAAQQRARGPSEERYIIEARRALSAYERVRKLYSIETGVTEVRTQSEDVST